MNTYKETILQAVQTAITNANITSNVFRSRYTPLSYENGEFPAIVIKRGQETIDNLNQNASIRRFQVLIESHARGTPSDQEADKLASQVALTLLSDSTLGGLVNRVFESEVNEPEFADSDGIQCSIPAVYTFTYATSSKNPNEII